MSAESKDKRIQALHASASAAVTVIYLSCHSEVRGEHKERREGALHFMTIQHKYPELVGQC